MASFKAASLRPFDLWPSHWGIKMLKHQKKSICAASERLLLRWSKLSALLCLERTYIFFDLDCPALVYCPALVWLSSLGLRPWLDTPPDLRKWKFSHDKETSLSSFVTFWASLQRQHRTVILFLQLWQVVTLQPFDLQIQYLQHQKF